MTPDEIIQYLAAEVEREVDMTFDNLGDDATFEDCCADLARRFTTS